MEDAAMATKAQLPKNSKSNTKNGLWSIREALCFRSYL